MSPLKMKKNLLALCIFSSLAIIDAHANKYDYVIEEDGRSWCYLECGNSLTKIASDPRLGFEIENHHHCDILGRDICEKKSGFNPTEAGKKLKKE